jgi:3-hydroxymyristoyl/3-hydroxydecanoyl-(acyl carrier protein) dehydratase
VLAGAEPRHIFSSGAPLPLAAARAAEIQFRTFPIEVLGSTETGGIAWRQQSNDDALWSPLPGVHLGVDVDGLLSVRSPFAGSELPLSTGDIVEFEVNGFRLKGRGDRVAKINGKRISLVRVEEALTALPHVVAAAVVDLPSRKGDLGVVVELNAEGRIALGKLGAFRLSRDMRRALSDRLEPAERPKHWQFGVIPVDRLGKRLQSALHAMFDLATRKLRGQGRVIRVDHDTAEIQIELVPEMIWFEGHFPGQPVLAGIAQVHIASLWAELAWNWRPPSGNLKRLKFKKILIPGDVVELKLVRSLEKQQLGFAYRLNGSIASDGTIGEGA